MKIAKELSIQKRKNASGNIKWSAERVMRVLKKSTYAGIIAYGQSHSNNYLEQKRINNLNRDTNMYQKIDIPVIIPKEEWGKVQEIIASRTQKMGDDLRGKKEVKEFWSKKLLCKCGSSFRRNKWRTNKTGEEVFGYQCQHIFQPDQFRQTEVHASRRIIEIGMGGIDHQVILAGLHHAPLDIGRTGQGFEGFKGQRMMRDNQITPHLYRLVHHLFGDVEAKKRTGSRLIHIAYLHTCIVKALLQWQRSVLFDFFQYILNP